MSEGGVSYRIMRLMVLFDMPVLTDEERREYVHFRNFIMDDGFMMLQYSVYTRYCANDTDAEKHCKRIQDNKPKYGNVRILKITENQFTSMVLVQGEKTAQEAVETSEQLLFI